MKQSEAKSFVVGIGAATILETSNREDNPLPRLTVMMPWCPGYADEQPIPAHSMSISGKDVRQLYDALHAYYTSNTSISEISKRGAE